MADEDIISILRETPWSDVASFLALHEATFAAVAERFPQGLPIDEGAHPDRPGYPDADDARALLYLSRTSGPAMVEHYARFAVAEHRLGSAHNREDREDLYTEALSTGLIVTRDAPFNHLIPRLAPLCSQVEALRDAPTQLAALAAAARSEAFTPSGDIEHADAAVEGFRRVIAPDAGLSPLEGAGLDGARMALALILAARNRARTTTGATRTETAASDRSDSHDDLLEAIAIARAVADVASPPTERSSLAVNTLLTLLAELLDLTRSAAAADEAIAIVTRLADEPPTVRQHSVIAFWYQMRFAATDALSDIDRALSAVDDALSAAVDPATNHRIDTDEPTVFELLETKQDLWSTRHEHTTELDDLRQSVQCGDLALELRPRDPGIWAQRANQLASAWRQLADRCDGRAAPLERAVALSDKALAHCPPQHRRSQAAYRRSLVDHLVALFDATGSTDALDRAVMTTRLAIADGSLNDANLLVDQTTLAELLLTRYLANDDPEDHGAAAILVAEVMARTPADSPHHLCREALRVRLEELKPSD